MPLTKTQIIIVGAVALIVLIILLGALGIIPIFKGGGGGGTTQGDASLLIWGVDDSLFIKTAIESYQNYRPGVKINYQQFSELNYENSLLNAMATGKGPDVFMFHRSWLTKHGDKIVPAPDDQFSLYNLRQMFPDVIESDFSTNQKVYALPLYLDTLTMFYNKEIFNSKGIALTPTTWDDLKNLLPALTEFDFNRQIKKAGAAIGGSDKSINSASDLATELIFQFNPGFKSQKTKPLIFESETAKAMDLYFQFSNPSSNYYTWSDNFTNSSIDAFASGDAAIIFNYNSAASSIKLKNPYLNFTVAPLPQINPNQPVNFADYWGLAVAKQSKQQRYGWDFIVYTTANAQSSLNYLKESRRPPALRQLINQYINDVDLSAFAKQALSAKSAFQKDNIAFRKIISNMIESVLSGKLNIDAALKQTAAEINNP